MKIVVSGNLMRFTQYQKELVVDGPTVQTVLGELVVRFPDLRGVLLDGSGRLRTMHRAFLNGEELLGDEVSRSVGAEDELALLTAIAGG